MQARRADHRQRTIAVTATKEMPVGEMARDGALGDPHTARVNIAADHWHPTRDL
jgi:hypothetical protein